MNTAGLDCRNDSMTEFLFVYGTLRSEFPHPLAKQLSTQARFVGKGSTPGLLYDFGWYPGAKFDPHARTHVIGEVSRSRTRSACSRSSTTMKGLRSPAMPSAACPSRCGSIAAKRSMPGPMRWETRRGGGGRSRAAISFIIAGSRTNGPCGTKLPFPSICVGRSRPLKGAAQDGTRDETGYQGQ